MKSYQDLFEVRGSSYDLAMRQHPGARAAEFQQIVERANLSAGMHVADVPAGGGYLRAYLPGHVVWSGHEPCTSFQAEVCASTPLAHQQLLPLPWHDHSMDVVISLAGVHHIEDKRALFSECLRVTKPGGMLALSDVAAHSDVALFLDQFVDAHNSTGHRGTYLDQRTLDELEESGWTVHTNESVRYHWCFEDHVGMADFCRKLFDLRNTSDVTIQKAIEKRLGIDKLPSGRLGMRWSLMTITARKQGEH